MERTPSALSPELLLRQADFVRSLARSLLADPGAAEDVAQDALVTALEQPPASSGALRVWLARVVRNLVAQRRRGEARRLAREERSAHAESIPSVADVLQRESLRAEIVGAVLSLREPYRTVILLRFYEGRGPRAIAALLAVPVETVRTRTKTALALLRQRLDREFGERSAWAALLVPFTRLPVGPTGERAPVPQSSLNQRKPLMHPALKLTGLGVVLVTGAAFWLRSGSPEPVSAAPAVHTVVSNAQASDSQGTGATAFDDSGRAAVRSAPVVALPAKTSAPVPPAPVALSTSSLRLTVSWSDGSPAADVQVRATDVGRPSYDALEARTDGAGSCSFAGLRAGMVSVQVDRKARRDSATLVAGEETVLALQIPRGFDVEGIVRDESGAPVAGAAVWLGRTMEPAFLVATSAADGSFSVRSLQKWVSLWARADGHAPTLARVIDQADDTVAQETLELRDAGAAVSGSVLDADGHPIEGAAVLVDGQGMEREEGLPPGVVALSSASTRGAHSGPVWVRTDADGRFTVGGVRPGIVPLGVLAPGHAPWRGSLAVAAGASASTEITLFPGWSLSGLVVDPQGNPSAGRLYVHLASVPGLLCPSVEIGPDGTFELQDLAPGSLSVWIHGAGGDARTTLSGQAGDALDWDAYLGPEEGAGPEIDSWDE